MTVVTLLAILLVLLIGAGQVIRSRSVALETASQQAHNLANVLAQHAARTMGSVDLILTGVQERLRSPDRTTLKDFLERRAASLPQVHKLQVMTPDGDWAYDSIGDHPPRSSGDRAYFRWHREHDDPGLHIDVPILSRFDGASVIPLSRRLSGPDGAFEGVVSATLHASHFQAFYDTIKIGKESAIALWLGDGRLLAREPVPSPAMPRDISRGRLFTQVLPYNATGVMQTTASAVDGIPRIVGFQRVDGMPLVVTASISVNDALAAWRYDAMVQAVVMGIATLALGGLATGLERRSRRAAASERASQEAQTLFKGLFENAVDCLYVFRAEPGGEFRLETWNPAASALRGIDEARAKGRTLDGLFGRQEAAAVRAGLTQVVTSGQPARTEEQTLIGNERRTWETVHVPLREVGSKEIGRVFMGVRDITHLKATEAEAREANRLLVLAEQIARVGHWHIALSTMAVTWSEEVYRIHGLDPAGFTPSLQTALSCYHRDDRDSVERQFSQAVETGTGFNIEARIVRPDGETRHVQVRGFLEAAGAESRGGTTLFGVLADVTELKQAERALAEKSALFEATLQSMDQGLLMIAGDGTVPIANDRAVELLALPRDLVKKRPTYRALREHIRRSGTWGESIEDSKYWYLDEDRRTADLISERRRADGSVIEIRSMPIQGGNGYVQTLTDITDRRRAEERLRESEARYRLLADYTSDLIVLCDARGVAGYVSPAARQILGYGVDEIMEVGLIPLTQAEDVAQLTSRLEELSQACPTGSVLYRMRHREGHLVWIEAGLRLVEEAGVARIVMALRDVTLRQRQAAHLEQAKAAAEAGARIKAEFLANMSHELRTPLTGMLGVHDLLKSDPGLSPAQGRLVSLAQESGRSLLTIVNDILDFSKMEAGQLAIEALPFSLHELISNCRELTAESARIRNLTVITDIAAEMPDRLIGDPARLRQVLLNLTTNAIKFTAAGSVTVSARCLSGGAEPRVRIEVTDTGIGIAADKVPHLFQRFSQADGSISRQYGGTGLGLAISRGLVELMDGDIGVLSRLGSGSTFWFEVPLARQPDATELKHVPAPSSGSRSYRILLAEDNEINQEIISAILRQRGHSVDVVGDGVAAVAAVTSGTHYDVVLMDVQMPGKDGLAAAAAIRADEAGAERGRVPIIALTANALAEEVARCSEAGMDAHVAKPVNWTELFAAIARLTHKADAAKGEGAGPPRGGAIDETMLAMLVELLGPDKAGSLLRTFAVDLRQRIALLREPDATAQTLASQAHALVSLAGQLGLVELSALASELEAEARKGGGLDRIGELDAFADRAITAVERTRYWRSAPTLAGQRAASA